MVAPWPVLQKAIKMTTPEAAAVLAAITIVTTCTREELDFLKALGMPKLLTLAFVLPAMAVSSTWTAMTFPAVDVYHGKTC